MFVTVLPLILYLDSTVLSPQIEDVHFRFKLYSVANQPVLLYKLVQYIIDICLFLSGISIDNC